MVNKGLIGSPYSLSNLSLPFTSSLTIVATKIDIVKVWTCKGMVSKHVPSFSRLTGLLRATSCTADGVAGILLLVPISIDTKLGGFVLEIKESSSIGVQLKLVTLFIKVG